MKEIFPKLLFAFSLILLTFVLITVFGCATGGGYEPAPCRSTCYDNPDGPWSVCDIKACAITYNQKYFEGKPGYIRSAICICTVSANTNEGNTNPITSAGGGGNTNNGNTVNKETTQEAHERMMQEDEQWKQEVETRFAEYDKTLPVGKSSVTSNTNNQNIGNPQINNIATGDGIIRGSGRGQGTGSQRTGGNVTNRSQQPTARDSQSANPNAANNIQSRRDGASGSLSYTEQQPAGSSQQQQEKIIQHASGTTIARVATAQQQTPQMQAVSTIVEFTTTRQRPEIVITTPSKRQENQTIPSANTGGYEFKDEKVRQSCATLSPTGIQILTAIDEVAKELNVTIIITDGDRPWEQQLFYLLDSQESYSGSTNEFIRIFGVTPPRTIDELTTEQKEWYRQRIEAQAGRSPGFPHIGGNAVDIRVSDFSINGKRRLDELFTTRGIKKLYEIPPTYDVPRNNATVFHLYK